MSDYDLVVFDWDGTLMNSTHGIVSAIQGACRDLGLPVPPPQAASWVIGLSLESALMRAAPGLTAKQMPLFLERYRTHYLLRDADIRLFDGVPALLEALAGRGARLAVATGKSRAGLDRVLRNTGLTGAFDATRTADETAGKPDPRMLHEILDELGVAPGRALMVGDTSHDLRMAANAGLHGLGVSYGAHEESELLACEPEAVVPNVEALRDWLLARV